MDFRTELERLAELEVDYQQKLAVFREVSERNRRNPVFSKEHSDVWREVEATSRVTFDLAQDILRHAQEAVQAFIKEQGLDGVLAGALARKDFVETFNLNRE